MARIDRTERLLNVVFCLLGSTQPIPRNEIRRVVSGYDPNASDAAFERMFERDKDELRSMGIAVETIVDVNGEAEGYLIRKQASSAQLQFNADELALLALAAAVSQEAILEASATTALRKIETISGDAPEIEVPANIRMSASDAALLPLMAALREQHMVSFDYLGRKDETAERRNVDPWGVIASHGAWYLVGHDRERQSRRTFRLSRIQGSVTVTAKALEVARPSDLSLIDVVRGEDAEHASVARVAIEAGAGAALRLANQCTASPFDTVEMDIRAVTEQELVSQICSAGAGVIVLEPDSIRTLVQAALQAVAEKHGSRS